HITDEIKRRIQLLGNTGKFDFVITEIGGTVGDIESFPFVEAIRQMRWEMGKDCAVIHLTLVPYLSAAGELKTKPTQHSVKTMLEQGVQPDIIVCRTEHHLNEPLRTKIAQFCNVELSSVIESMDASSIYEVPLLMLEEKLDVEVLRKTNTAIPAKIDIENWKSFLTKLMNPENTVTIALVGKYVELKDAYKSIYESLIHGGVANECAVKVKRIHSEHIEGKNLSEIFQDVDGILVAPGFGPRGIEGKINAIRYARENNIPFFGICLGMQCAVIEFSRHVLGHKDAHSSEMNPATSHAVIDLMPGQKNVENLGGTMRLGAYSCRLEKGSRAFDLYGEKLISERHRHRYEFNNSYRQAFLDNGMKLSGINPENDLVEIIELPSHPWYIGVQFHPEYKSTVARPHPLFKGFIEASLKKQKASGQGK
ncbi:MAG TPA: CTP synthase, partial [Bacteroidales bacterium]|nr:CTP synthase [Bacteroidales bacterium]